MTNRNYKIYPNQYLHSKVNVDRGFVFVIMPFGEKFDPVYSRIKKALKARGYKCQRADKLGTPSIIMADILDGIMRAEYVIADLTELNPNVFYELGVVHSFKDVACVIEIRQKDAYCPFDIRHIKYFEYSPYNLKKLVSDIMRRIEQAQDLQGFREALVETGVIHVLEDAEGGFVSELHERFGRGLEDLTKILNREDNPTAAPDWANDAINRYHDFVHEKLAETNAPDMEAILRLYAELIGRASYCVGRNKFMKEILEDFFAGSQVREEQRATWRLDMAMTVIGLGQCYEVILPYFLQLLERPRVGRIDLNHNKLEEFFVQCSDVEVNEALVKAISHGNQHVRESAADIVGTKKLKIANEALVQQLEVEDNTYVARSILIAVGGLGVVKAQRVFDWVAEHEQWLKDASARYVVEAARAAIVQLDGGQGLLDAFDKRFGDVPGSSL